VGGQVEPAAVVTLVNVETMVAVAPEIVVGTVIVVLTVETRPVGQIVAVDVTVLTPVPGTVVVTPGKVTVLRDVQAPVTVVETIEQVAPVDDEPHPQPPPQPPPICVPQTVRVLIAVAVEAVQVFMEPVKVTVVGTVRTEVVVIVWPGTC